MIESCEQELFYQQIILIIIVHNYNDYPNHAADVPRGNDAWLLLIIIIIIMYSAIIIRLFLRS